MIGGVETEGLSRNPGGDERLDESVWGPGLLLAGLDDHRRLEGDGRDPQGIHGRRVAGHHQTEGVGRGEEGKIGAELLAASFIEDGEVEPTGESVKDFRHVGQGVMNLRHVPLHHHMGQTAGAAEGLDVLVGALGMATVS